jgi:LPXTG-motif cell wall-anchored protein
VAVNGNGTYASAVFTSTTVGDHRWVVIYDGDDDNNAAVSPCGSSGETSTVLPAGPTSTTTSTPTPVPSRSTPTPGPGGSIPRTGSDPGGQLLLGLGAILAGFGFVLLVGRREEALT